MPDWYVLRNGEGYQVRLGGCEYSLTEDELNEFRSAIETVMSLDGPGCIESAEYQDIVICNSDQKVDLRELLGRKPEPFKRRF